MNLNRFIIFLSTLLGIILTGAGGYLLAVNLINHLSIFEGVVILSLGVTDLLLVTVASALERTIMTFQEIYTTQIEMQIKVQEEINRQNQLRNNFSDIDSLLNGLTPNDITITDLSTGKSSSLSGEGFGDDLSSKINNMIGNMMSGRTQSSVKKEISEMSLDELNSELKKTLKKENFEKAAEIKKFIEDKEKPKQ